MVQTTSIGRTSPSANLHLAAQSNDLQGCRRTTTALQPTGGKLSSNFALPAHRIHSAEEGIGASGRLTIVVGNTQGLARSPGPETRWAGKNFPAHFTSARGYALPSSCRST